MKIFAAFSYFKIYMLTQSNKEQLQAEFDGV